MKIIKKVLIGFVSIGVLLVVLLGVYWLVKRQSVIESFDINRPGLEHNILIASQGSKFKNALVGRLIDDLKEGPVYVKVIDVTKLPDVKEEEWDAVVILHTTEMWKIPSGAKRYLDNAKDLGKVVLVTTSGAGNWETDYKIDTITSASGADEVEPIKEEVLRRLEKILR